MRTGLSRHYLTFFCQVFISELIELLAHTLDHAHHITRVFSGAVHGHYWPNGTVVWRCAVPTSPLITMNKALRPLRRAAVYGAFSYLGLVVINNSSLDLPSLWIVYLPMFVGVYALTIWIDQKFSS